MGRDLTLRDQDGTAYSYSNIKTNAWLQGQSAGVDKAAVVIDDLAVAAFRANRDEEATRLRALAKNLRSDLAEALRAEAKRHAEVYPDVKAGGE